MVNIDAAITARDHLREWWSERPSPFAASKRTGTAELSVNYSSTVRQAMVASAHTEIYLNCEM